MKWETSRPFLVLYNGCSSQGSGNSRKTFQIESQTLVGDRARSLADLLDMRPPKSKPAYQTDTTRKSKSAYQTDTTRKTLRFWTDIYEVA